MQLRHITNDFDVTCRQIRPNNTGKHRQMRPTSTCIPVHALHHHQQHLHPPPNQAAPKCLFYSAPEMAQTRCLSLRVTRCLSLRRSVSQLCPYSRPYHYPAQRTPHRRCLSPPYSRPPLSPLRHRHPRPRLRRLHVPKCLPLLLLRHRRH